MKITINLTEPEKKGIKLYLESLDGKKATNLDVKQYIQGVVSTTIYAPQEAVSDYIKNN